MDENHRDNTDIKLILPPLSPKDQKLSKKLNGYKKAANKWRWGFSDKTGWDWLQFLLQFLTVLALPIALFVAAQWFSTQQSKLSVQASDRQHQTDLQITEDQQEENALQTYLDRMSDLLLNDKLRQSRPGDEVRDVARARTLTVLSQLNGIRKREVVRFLYEADLISTKSDVIINLYGIDLRHASLAYADLFQANLSYAYLSYADLDHADLREIDLSSSHLLSADLSYADLSKANMSGANLDGANLKGAKGITSKELEKIAQSLRDTIMPDGSKHP